MLRSVLKFLGAAAFVLTVAGFTAWGGMALWYRAPGAEWMRLVLCVPFVLLGSYAIFARVRSGRWRPFVAFAIASVALLGWWATILPPSDRDWAPEVARQATGQIDGDLLRLTDIRDFEWRPDGSYTENWITRTYDLGALQTVDLFMSYWAGPAMAHFILSFGFTNGDYLAWSIEVKRSADGSFSPIADLFKENPIVIVAATERDVVGLRTNIRGEDVRLFRLRSEPNRARALLEEYVRDANLLAEQPRWYHSLSTNCTTVVVKMLNAIGSGLPFDWRLIVNGYLPELSYERGALNTEYSIRDLRRLGSVTPKGQAFTLKPGFSEAIRAGVPSP